MRLDQYFTQKYPEFSRSSAQKFIKDGLVKVNNVLQTSVDYKVHEQDILDFTKPEKQPEINIPIIYQDENVIVIDKPAGILSHAKGAYCDEFTVADFAEKFVHHINEEDTIKNNRIGIVHRLDRDTSGVMILARNDETRRFLQKQFSTRKTKKTYIAIVEGCPENHKANIDLPIERNPKKPATFRVGPNGKSAQTYYEVISGGCDNSSCKNNRDKANRCKKCCSTVLLKPTTGRTHQLRVHMQYIGCPIVGDRFYSKDARGDERLMLHAKSLEITLPGGDRRVFEADLPAWSTTGHVKI